MSRRTGHLGDKEQLVLRLLDELFYLTCADNVFDLVTLQNGVVGKRKPRCSSKHHTTTHVFVLFNDAKSISRETLDTLSVKCLLGNGLGQDDQYGYGQTLQTSKDSSRSCAP